MSFKALAWAVDQQPGRASDKLILLGLADRHNTDEGYARPSIAWLQEFSGLDRKTIIASLDRLEGLGLIADTGVRYGQTMQVKAYSLSLESVGKTEPFQKRNRSTFSGEQSQKRNTEPVKEPVSPKASPSTKDARSQFWPPDGVSASTWADFLKTRKREGHPLETETAYNRLCSKITALKQAGHSPEELVAEATERGWRTVFPPRDGKGGTRNGTQSDRPQQYGNSMVRAAAAFLQS